ncbi:MAG TPA: ribosome maturation factor [Sutterella sp.]|nr:ribosome maturation factor [Sutterella sp.]
MQKSSAEIARIAQDAVEGLGYAFVEFERLSRGLLRVTIDSEKQGGVGVDDCERVSDQLTRLFAVEEIDFERLEIASPGVDRPLKRLADWTRFIGRVAHVELFEPLYASGLPEAGRRKFDGKILSVDENDEMIEFSIEEIPFARTPSEAARAKKLKGKVPAVVPVSVRFPFADVDRANLIAQLDFKGNKR